MPTLSNGIVYQDLGTHDAAEYAEYARQERERRRQAQQNAAPFPQPAPQQNSVPKTVPDRGLDVKTALSAPMDAAEQTRRSQLQDGARSAYENYLGSYASQAQNEEKNIAQTGKSVMDTAYVFNEAWNAVKNNTAFAGNVEQQQAFVTNAAISFANASAVAHGWELVDQANVDGKNAWTGYNSETGTWDFVFRDKNGNFFTKHTTMDQVASQLKNNGYYPDDADKSKDKGGKGGDETPASAGKGGESKPPAEPNVGDISKRYNGFYTKTYDENGKETGYSLSEEGEQFMLGELETATGVERRYLLNAIASQRARSALSEAGSQNPHDPNGPTFKSEYDKALQDLKKNYGDPSSAETSGNQAPSDALEAFAKSVAIGKTNDAEVKSAGLGESFKRLSNARTERQEAQRAAAANARSERSVYVNGRWVKQGDIDNGTVKDEQPEGEWVNGIKRDALNAKKAENEARDAARGAPKVSDEQRVKDLDDMLDRYGREDDEEWDRNNADYFDKDGAQLDPSEVTKDANGNLVDKNGDPVRKEIWDDGTGGYDVTLAGGRARVDMSGVRKTDERREKEIFDAVMQMDPATRRRLATETDENGRLTYRASKVRQALGAFVDKENIRDFSNAEGTMEGSAKRSDGSDRTAASVTKTYRDSKGGFVMEETFDGGRLTEQGREARINALLDAEIDPETGIADTRGDAERMSRTERSEHGKSVDRRRAQIASINAQLEEADRKLHNDALREEGWMAEEDIENKDREQYLANPRSDVSENVANTEEMQSAANAGQMTASESQRREWANRDRSKDSPAPEPPVSEPAASEPENKPSGPAPLPDNPKERRSAVKKDKNYGSIVESANANGTYTLTDSAFAKLEEKGLTKKDMTPEQIENWIHFGDEYLDKHAELKKRIASNQAAEDERARMQRAEHERKRKEEQERINRRSRVANKISERGGDFANASDEKLRRMFPDKRDYEIAVQIRAQKKKYAKTVR